MSQTREIYSCCTESAFSYNVAAHAYRKSEAPSLANSLCMGSAAGDTSPPAGTTPHQAAGHLCTRDVSSGAAAEAASPSSPRRFAAAGLGLSRGNGGQKAGGFHWALKFLPRCDGIPRCNGMMEFPSTFS